MMSDVSPRPLPEPLRRCCQVLDDKKAETIRIFEVSKQSSLTDFLVLATGTSEPHLRALRNELEKVLDETGTRLVGTEGEVGTGWTVIDGFEFMIHLFTRETRDHYQLESLWGDGVEIALADALVAKPVTIAAPKAKGRKAGTRSRTAVKKVEEGVDAPKKSKSAARRRRPPAE